MPKTKALGTTLSYLPTYDSVAAVKLIGAVSSIGEIAPSADEIDVTTLASVAKEFLQGQKDSGNVSITGFHDITDTGQVQMRTLFGSGAIGYFWVTFPDSTVVAFNAIVTGYKAGSADVGGAVGFGATMRVSGLVQVISPKLAVAQAKTAGQTATVDATATALKGTPGYQWYSNDENNYASPTIAAGETSATYTTGALNAGVYYYFCVITVTGWKPINSQIHVITVT